MKCLLIAMLVVMTTSSFTAREVGSRHPLSNLTVADVDSVCAIVRRDSRFPMTARFVSVAVQPPDKRSFIAARNAMTLPRLVVAVVYDPRPRQTYEVYVDLRTRDVAEFRMVEKVQPMVMLDEYDSVSAIVRASPRFDEAMKRRGIVDPSTVAIDAWATGIPTTSFPQRLFRAICYMKNGDQNDYDRPVEGVLVLVDMTNRRIVEFVDRPLTVVPRATPTPDERRRGSKRATLGRLDITQPSIPFTVNDGEVVWQNWKFRYVMNPRTGLELHDVRWLHDGTARSVAHQIYLSEMVVPYGDTSSLWYWRNAFDVGEYGVGMLSSPLERGAEVPGNAALFPAAFVTSDGEGYATPDVVGIYERDGGILWKHRDALTGSNQARRGRELVVMHIATVGNYDYALQYVFGLDGSVRVEVGLTGVMLAKGTTDTVYSGNSAEQKFAHLVAPNVLAPTHQHFFSFRMDLDIDDTSNVFSEVDVWAPSARDENPHGNAMMMDDYDFRYERGARRSMDASRARVWKIASADSVNAIGIPTAYLLIPGANAVPYMMTANPVRKRAGFIEHHVWVTRQHDAERYAAGDYPNQSTGGDGLPAYVRDNESIYRKDIVLWYTMGVTHVARPEEWPIMPTTTVGFKLLPAGFFDANPALDLAPTVKKSKRK